MHCGWMVQWSFSCDLWKHLVWGAPGDTLHRRGMGSMYWREGVFVTFYEGSQSCRFHLHQSCEMYIKGMKRTVADVVVFFFKHGGGVSVCVCVCVITALSYLSLEGCSLIFTCICVCTYTHSHIHTHTHRGTHTHTNTCAYSHTQAGTHTHKYAHAWAHTCMHTLGQTHSFQNVYLLHTWHWLNSTTAHIKQCDKESFVYICVGFACWLFFSLSDFNTC